LSRSELITNDRVWPVGDRPVRSRIVGIAHVAKGAAAEQIRPYRPEPIYVPFRRERTI